jgi:hypothetical protein
MELSSYSFKGKGPRDADAGTLAEQYWVAQSGDVDVFMIEVIWPQHCRRARGRL